MSRLKSFMKESSVTDALDISEPEIGKKYDDEAVASRKKRIQAAIKQLRGQSMVDDEAKEAMLADLNDKLDKWENVEDETAAPKAVSKTDAPPEDAPPEDAPPEDAPPEDADKKDTEDKDTEDKDTEDKEEPKEPAPSSGDPKKKKKFPPMKESNKLRSYFGEGSLDVDDPGSYDDPEPAKPNTLPAKKRKEDERVKDTRRLKAIKSAIKADKLADAERKRTNQKQREKVGRILKKKNESRVIKSRITLKQLVEELIIHVFKNHNGSFYLETNKDDVVGDNFKTARDAKKYADKKWPKATIYDYEGK